jgi:predicted DNA-binding helix-hairpin-helix protein
MCYNSGMSELERLELLTRQMHLEPAEDYHPCPLPAGSQQAITVKAAQLPNGQSIRLLKTLLSSYCENNCLYCPFRAQRDFRRAAFTPDDFARLFNTLYHSGFVEGLFLSSSITNGPISTQDKLLDTAAILRQRYHYQGYLHLKIMPGSQQAQVEQAMRLADRLSVNLEAPHQRALTALAPRKRLQADLIDPLLWIHQIRQNNLPVRTWKGRWPSSITQFVVGAAGESDLDLLSACSSLFHNAGISRAYFSSFSPMENTPLENLPASPPQREYRLYQAFFLLRDYGFELEDLVYNEDGNLPMVLDPKTSWAEIHLKHQPLEINSACREELLKVPGLGPARVESILKLRRQGRITSLSQLSRSRLISKSTLPYILVDGKTAPAQLRLL